MTDATNEILELAISMKWTAERIIDLTRNAGGTSSRPAASSTSGPVFPNYGRSKNAPVSGASMNDLDYYASGCRKSIADPAKSRWHDKERVLLAAIESEIARQGGTAPVTGGGGAPDFSGTDDDLPFIVDDTFREALR